MTRRSIVTGPKIWLQAQGSGFAAPDIASVNFNDGTTGVFSNDYPGSITIINDPTGGYPGEKICRIPYTVSGPAGGGNVDDNTSISFTYPTGKTDLYQRMYVYFVNPGTQGGIEVEKLQFGLQRKLWYINAGEGPDYWTGTIQRYLDGATGTMDNGIYGPRSVTKTGQPDFIETEFSGAIDVLLDTWYYFEYRVKLNTVGQGNGIVQIWGGIKGASGLANALLYQTTTATLRLNSNNYLSCRVGQQLDAFPNGHTINDIRYIKNLAISTQRIGP